MEALISVLAAATLFLSGLFGVGGEAAHIKQASTNSVELGLSEMSPLKEAGGFAMPASGCSVAVSHGQSIHDCDILPDISTDLKIIRLGESVEVSWDPRMHVNCVLSSNVMSLPPAPDANIPDSRVDQPTGEVTYRIVCAGEGNEDAATVKVLPRFQET